MRKQVSVEFTQDSAFEGGLLLVQPKTGYRFNTDSLHLAEFARGARAGARAADLGAGMGVVGLGLLHLGIAREVHLVENDKNRFEALSRNVSMCTGRAVAHFADIESWDPEQGAFDLVIFNPPYFERGRVSPDESRRAARGGSLQTFTTAARRLVGKRGKVALVYPVRELSHMFATLERDGLYAKRIRMVHGRASRQARVALVMAQPGKPGGLTVEPPLVEHATPT